ncbi:MAG: ATP-binding protein [Chloroflexi bacterium]|nr:ATP-binding protein [Chloroflexota bacterium]
MFAHYQLRTKLWLAFFGVVLVSVVLVSFFNSRTLRQELVQDVGAGLQTVASSQAQAVGDWVAKEVDTLQALSVNRVIQEELALLRAQTAAFNRPPDPDPLNNDIAAELLRYRNIFPQNVQVLATDFEGKLVANTTPAGQSSYGQELWWQAAYNDGRGGLFIGQPYADDYVVIALPVYGREAQIVVGVLYTSFHLNVIEDILNTGNNPNRHSELYLPQGRTFRVQDNLFIGQRLGEADAVALELLWQEGTLTREITYREAPQLASWAAVTASDPSSRLTIAALNWRVVSYESRESVLQAVGKGWQTTFWAGTAALLIASVLASALATQLTKPIARLTSAARRVAEGEAGVQAAVESGDEIGLLATAFNQMTQQLSQSMAALQQRTHMLETSAQVARAASASLALDDVLETTVQNIGRQFGFYVASVFIVEPETNTAVLRASTHEPLRQRGHRLVIGSRSLVGQAAVSKRPCLAQNVQQSAIHYANPLLPETRSEAAFPLIFGQTVIGALDVQSRQVDQFPPEIVALLTTLADQIAIAVQHAQLYEELKATADRLTEVDRLKTAFLASMSHELRTPLNSIIGFSKIMLKGLDGPLTELQEEDLQTIHNSGQHLLGIITNILDLTKIEAGHVELEREALALCPLLEESMAHLNGLVRDKPIRTVLDVPTPLPPIWGDGTRVRQILLNLLSNAAKFTDSGEIRLAAVASSQWVTVSVRDTGIGIPANQYGAIFEEFTQVDNSYARQYEGTGLGLPITKKLVELHGGHIWVISQLHYGSTFSFTLPLAEPLSLNGAGQWLVVSG